MERLEAAILFCKQHGLVLDFKELSGTVIVHYEQRPYVLSAQGHDVVSAVVALRTDMEALGIIKGGIR